MSKTPVNKGKVALFVLGATVANLVLMVVCFVLLMLLYSVLLSKILPPRVLSGRSLWHFCSPRHIDTRL